MLMAMLVLLDLPKSHLLRRPGPSTTGTMIYLEALWRFSSNCRRLKPRRLQQRPEPNRLRPEPNRLRPEPNRLRHSVPNMRRS